MASQIQTYQSTIEKTQAELAASGAQLKKINQILPIVIERTSNLKTLYDDHFVSKVEYMQSEQEHIQYTQDLEVERQRAKQLRAVISEVHETMNIYIAQSSSSFIEELTDLQRQILAYEEELVKAKNMNAKKILYAPVSGRIQELAINTVGGVVTEAQQLMLIVPDEEQIEAEVFLNNKDIGFVYEGMTAEIKIHTFPFTKYGVIDAEVTNISDDALVDERRGLIYSMQLRLAKNTIWVKDKEVRLASGMAVTAEMQIGKRQIIDFFLSPLKKYRSESIRER